MKCGTQDIKGISAAIKEQIYGKSAQVVFWGALLVRRGLWGEVTPGIVRRSAVGRTEELFGSMI